MVYIKNAKKIKNELKQMAKANEKMARRLEEFGHTDTPFISLPDHIKEEIKSMEVENKRMALFLLPNAKGSSLRIIRQFIKSCNESLSSMKRDERNSEGIK